jgi:hypothetical protein
MTGGCGLPLLFLVIAILWALKAPVGDPSDASTPEALAERQRQIERANHTEFM